MEAEHVAYVAIYKEINRYNCYLCTSMCDFMSLEAAEHRCTSIRLTTTSTLIVTHPGKVVESFSTQVHGTERTCDVATCELCIRSSRAVPVSRSKFAKVGRVRSSGQRVSEMGREGETDRDRERESVCVCV